MVCFLQQKITATIKWYELSKFEICLNCQIILTQIDFQRTLFDAYTGFLQSPFHSTTFGGNLRSRRNLQTRTQSLFMSLGERERRLDSIEARGETWEYNLLSLPPRLIIRDRVRVCEFWDTDQATLSQAHFPTGGKEGLWTRLKLS